MRQLCYIFMFVACVTLVNACYEDESKLGGNPIREMEVTTNVRDTMNVYLGDTLSIVPQSSDTGANVIWPWSIGTYAENNDGAVTTTFKEISTEATLSYKTTELGHFYLRLMATNSDGSTIKYYHVFVNAEFEEGFLILGKKENGRGSLAFRKELTPEEIAQGMEPEWRQDLFAYANGGMELGEGPVDCEKVYDKLYIVCKEAQKAYQIDAKSFQLVFEFDYALYDRDFYPQDLMSYDSKTCSAIYSTSSNGGVAMIQPADLEIFPFSEMDQELTLTRSYNRPAGGYSNALLFIDDVNSKVYAKGWVGNSNIYFPCYDYFDRREIVHAFFDEKKNLLVYSEEAGRYYVTKVDKNLTNTETKGLYVLYDEECVENPTLLKKSSVIQVNDIHLCLFFGNQNKVYKWVYDQYREAISATPFITLPEGEVIKCMNQSVDQKQIYIATYNSSRPGLKGSLYVYDTDKGTIIGDPYEGIADEPVRVMYKVK